MDEPTAPQQPPTGDGYVALLHSSAVRARDATRYVETMIRQRPARRFTTSGRSAGMMYLRLTSTVAPDGGYQWQEVVQQPPILVTDGGTGYASTGTTATLSGAGWTGWSLAVTVTNGAVTLVTVTGTAGAIGTMNDPSGISISISGVGTGATAAITDPQLLGTGHVQWTDATATGNFSSAAYEASGCMGLGVDGTVYPAVVGTNGSLLFFCSASFIGVTTTLSSYPTLANVYYAVELGRLTGTQSEGSAGVLSLFGSTVLALNLGGSIPISGTQVVVNWTGTRFVFRYDHA